MRFAFLALALAATLPAYAEEAQEIPSKPVAVVDGHPVYGTAMPEGAATPIGSALAAAADHAGKPAKFEGRITKVCQTKGCWLVLADGEMHARVKFGNHDFFIPKDTSGNAVVYGTLEVKTLAEDVAKHLAEDAGQDPATVSGEQQEYRITATSVMLMGEQG
jgi:hypothetical protein